MQGRVLWIVSVSAALAIGIAVSSGDGISTAHAQRVFSTASIRGSYATSYCVALPNPSGPTQFLSGTGIFQADGAGHLTGHEITNTNGQVCSGTMTGTYAVNPDGTGALSVTFTATTPGCTDVSFQQSLVILDSGRIVRVADMMPTEVTIFEEWQKQM